MAVVVAATAWAADVDLGLPVRPAESAGFSAARLARVEAALKRDTEAGRFAGATWLVARDGYVVLHGAAGSSDLEQHVAMREDALFKIYSMTKIVTSVTVLTLLEEGRFNLDDPVARYLPDLGKMKVMTGGTADAPTLVETKRPITIRHLLTHTSGFGYDVLGSDRVQREIYMRANLWRSASLREFAAKAGQLPLKHPPGEGWTYGINTDLLGALVEAVTGQGLEDVMRERIFSPLKLTRTTFRPSPVERAALAKIYQRTPEGTLKAELPFGLDFSDLAGTFVSGGGGLVSTLHDYGRFAQMLLNGGELDGARVLGRKTVELMTSNHVGHLVPRPAGMPAGFGLGVQVAPAGAETARGLFSPGQFGWSGAASTYVSFDPKERMFVLLMMQHVPGNPDGIYERFQNTVYQALVK